MDLSIIVVSYNVKEYLLKCLASVYGRPPDRPFEVVVVDNASSDRSAAAVKDAYPDARILALQKNIGFAAANNAGVKAAAGRYLLFLNPDTEVGEGTLSGLLRYADEHSGAGLYTCRILNPDGTLQMSCFHFPSLRMAFYGFFPLVPMDSVANGRYPPETFDHEFEPEHVLGACILFPRDVLERIGNWDPGYFMYFEETDLCIRLRRAGLRALYTPEFSVIHHGGRSSAQVHEKMSVAFYRSQSRFYRKHYGLPRYIALKTIVAAGLGFWSARTLKNYVQRRIDGALVRTRLGGYLRILTA